MSRSYPFSVPSGINIVPEVSGIDNLGSAAKPFNILYANQIVPTPIASGNFLPLTGGTLSGDLNFSTVPAYINGPSGLFVLQDGMDIRVLGPSVTIGDPTSATAINGGTVTTTAVSTLYFTAPSSLEIDTPRLSLTNTADVDFAGAGTVNFNLGGADLNIDAGGNIKISGNNNLTLATSAGIARLEGATAEIHAPGSVNIDSTADIIYLNSGFGEIRTTGDIKPSVTNIYDLGSNSQKFRNVIATSGTFGTVYENGLVVINSGVGAGNVVVTNDNLGKLTISGTAFLPSSIPVTAPITNTAGTIGITTASTSTSGSLTSTNWNTFNTGATNASTALSQIAVVSGNLVTTNSNLATVSGIASTAVQNAANSGTGFAIFNSKSGTNLVFNTISGIGATTVSYANGLITISGTDTGITSILSSGVGISLVDGQVGTTKYINSISGIGTVSVTGPVNGLVSISGSNTADVSSLNSLTGAVTIAGLGNNTVTTAGQTINISGVVTTGSAPISVSAGVVSISTATTSTSGSLTSTDWNTFNNKQPSGTYNTTITSSGLGISLINTGGPAVTQILNSISGVGTVSITGPTNGIITISGASTSNGTTGKLIRDTNTILASGSVLNIGTSNVTTGAIGIVAGIGNTIDNTRSYAFGSNNRAMGQDSMAVGQTTTANGMGAYAEGAVTLAEGNYSHAEGGITRAMNYCSHAEGLSTNTSGNQAHAEGELTWAIGTNSHAQGSGSIAFADISHAEGLSTIAYGNNSHAQGQSTIASGLNSFAGGFTSKALGVGSVALGYNAIASASGSWIFADTGGASQTNSTANSLAMRFAGGVNLISGTSLTAGGDITTSGVFYGGNNIGIPLNQQSPKTFIQVTPLAATTVSTMGGGATVRATLSLPGWSTNYSFMQQIATSTTVGNDAGVQATDLAFAQTSGSGFNGGGGYFSKFRFATPDASYTGAAGCRIFIGMTTQATNVPTQADSFAGDNIGLQFCTASGSARQDTTFQIMSRNNSTTTISGLSGWSPTTNTIYELYLNSPSVAVAGVPYVDYKLVNITSGTNISGRITTTLPRVSTAMKPYIGIATWPSGAGVARNLRYNQIYVENQY
jgi:hypothetical protein